MLKINIKDNRVIVFLGLLLVALLAFNLAGAKDNKLNYFQDRDQDGLSDEEEKALGTDWQNPDTDGDGYTDGVEVSGGFNPLVPAPGDRFSEKDAKKVSKVVEVAGVKKERKNLTQEFIAKLKAKKGVALETFKEASSENGVVSSLDDVKKLKQVSLTEKDVRELAQETVKEVDVDSEIKEIPEEELNILPKVVAKSDKKKKAKIKKEIEDYLAETGFLMVSDLPFQVNQQGQFENKLTEFITGIGDDIVMGNDLETKRSKSKLIEFIDGLKKVETPYVLKDIHREAISLLQYLAEQDEEVVFRKDDPIAMGVMIGRLQAVMNKMQEVQGEMDLVLEKYGVNDNEELEDGE